MDKFVVVNKKSGSERVKSGASQTQSSARFAPYARPKDAKESEKDRDVAEEKKSGQDTRPERPKYPWDGTGKKPSTAVMNKYLLSTLKEPTNPLTHVQPSWRKPIPNVDYYWSTGNGHQVSENGARGRNQYLKERNKKLQEQQAETKTKLLSGLSFWIDGYIAGTTDLEMKRIIDENGGTNLRYESGATHILTSQQLSGARNQKFITKNTKIKVHVIRPEWVFDSIEAGKRQPEWKYSAVTNNTPSVLSFYKPKETS